MFAKVKALVGAVDDHGVFREAGFLQVIEHAADIIVHRCNAAQVILDVTLVLPAHKFFALEVGLAESLVLGAVGGVPGLALFGREIARRRDKLKVIKRHRFGDGHVLRLGWCAAALVIIKQRRRFGNGYPVVCVQVFRTRLPIAVWRLVLVHQHEGLVGRALVLEPVQRKIGDDIGGVTDVLGALAVLEHGRVVVGALANKHLGVVKAHGRHMLAQVPLANDRCLVAHLLQ